MIYLQKSKILWWWCCCSDERYGMLQLSFQVLFIGDSTNRGILHYVMEQVNGSLHEWDKTHHLRVYSALNANHTAFSFAYYPQFWLPSQHRPVLDKALYQLIKKWVLQPAGVLLIYKRKEGNVLFNDALNTFYLWLYGIRHMVKDHSDGLFFPISSKGSFIWERDVAPW